MTSLRAEVTAVILAGGEGRRMAAGEKPLVEVGGRRLIERVIDRIAPQVQTIILSCAGNEAAYSSFGLDIVSDGRERLGPLAGVEAGLGVVTTKWCLVCPADVPRLPVDLVDRLAAPAVRLAYPVTSERPQPLIMLLQPRLLDHLSASLDAGVRSVHDWVAGAGGVAVPFSDAAAFDNINTPEDLDRLREENPDETPNSR